MLELISQVPVGLPNPNSSGGLTAWLGPLLSIIATAIAGYFAWHVKSAETRHKDQLAASQRQKEIDLETLKLQYQSRADEAKQQTDFYAAMIKDYDLVRTRCFELERLVSALQVKLDTLESELKFFKGNHLVVEARLILAEIMNCDHNPAWIHDVGQNQWYLNDAYCLEYNVIRKNFWTAVNLMARYAEKDILEYIVNDQRVIATGVEMEFEEQVRLDIMNPKCTEFQNARFRKIPFRINDHNYVFGRRLEVINDVH